VWLCFHAMESISIFQKQILAILPPACMKPGQPVETNDDTR
jgi:hypothetical protein